MFHHICVNANQDSETSPEKSGLEPAAKENLRKALSGLEFTPEQTSDDQIEQQSTDEQLLSDVPPHHN